MRGTHIHSKSDEKIAIIGAGIALAILDNPIVIEQVVMMQIAQMWISVRGVQI